MYAASLRRLSLGDSISLSFSTKAECEACGGRGENRSLEFGEMRWGGGLRVCWEGSGGGYGVWANMLYVQGGGVSDRDVYQMWHRGQNSWKT
ncbi:MAG: hypothetical protein ACKESB_03325 [Candidatus Hodgkinia cicadicola]